jgi:4-hydroxybenzoate polyprenyltransferase
VDPRDKREDDDRGPSMSQDFTASDIPTSGWVAGLPGWAQPFARLARLDRPIGTWLLLFPCWWGLALAGSRDVLLYLLFAVGAVVMRGAGCTINDIIDRDLDARVARTADRPLPSGAVTLFGAFLFLGLELLLGLAILLLLPPLAIGLGVLSLVIVATYPLMKRVTWWPQIFLGLAFNWGVLMGWATVRENLTAAPLLLYLAGIFWTLGYDTIYAHQDKEDDARIGIRSTALRLGRQSRLWVAGFYAAMILLMMAAAALVGTLWIALPFLLLAALHAAWQVWKIDFDDPQDCLAMFRANRVIGWLVLAAYLAETALA